MSRTARLAIGSIVLSLGVVACGGTSGAPRQTPEAPSNTAGIPLPVVPTDASTAPGSSPSPTPPDGTSPVLLDPDLLDILPADIDGVPIEESADEAAVALADPGLPRIASGLDTGVAVDPASANLVLAYVVRLRDGAFTDNDFRQWRDSFDEGACAAAGGVVGLWALYVCLKVALAAVF